MAQEPVQPSAKATYARPSRSMWRSLKSSRFRLLDSPIVRQSPLFKQMLPIWTGSGDTRTVWKTGSGSRAVGGYIAGAWQISDLMYVNIAVCLVWFMVSLSIPKTGNVQTLTWCEIVGPQTVGPQTEEA